MNDVIRRRGPDGEGLYRDGPVGLGMRRLAIIDVEGGQQPIYNEDRTVAAVFNGEIYNYRQLRHTLQARGHTFATNSDSEVIVHLYEEFGVDLFKHLEGMFAIALWDARLRKLVLSRDRLGIKPLFIAELPQGLIFGSEIKSLLATQLVSDEIDYQALDEFLCYSFVPAPRTIYKQIRKVLPGTVLTIEAGGIRDVHHYWRIPDASVVDRPEPEWGERVAASLRTAVQSHLVSDVPVGAFLSGGVDSGLMVALMADVMDRPIETFTVGFTDAGGSFIDERIHAQQIAERYGLNHKEIEIEPNVVSILEDIVASFDEPFADDSVVPSYYVCQVAAGYVKVALTGLGGDELFAGYRRHLGVKVGDLYARVPSGIRKGLVEPLVQRLPEPRNSSDWVDHLKRFSRSSNKPAASRYQDSMASLPTIDRLSLYSSDVRNRVLAESTEQVIIARYEGYLNGTSVDRALKTDLATYLPDDVLTLTDRLSMWHSLELRVPFLDHRFVEEVMTIPADLKIKGFYQKYLLKQVAAEWLPPNVIDHRKQGFEAPMGRWLRTGLRPLLEDVLSREAIERCGWFDPTQVNTLVREHLDGVRKNSKILFSLMMLHIWHATRSRWHSQGSRNGTDVPMAAGSQ